jgi:glycosyltransferase involved in cell wall biosynthesis
MRILYHHRTLADGAEGVHIAAMVAAFRDLGHEVCVSGVTPAPAPETRHRVIGRVRTALPRAVFEVAAAGYNLLEYVQLRRLIGRFQPELLYARHARFGMAALAAARHLGVPSVLEVNCVFTSPDYERFEPHAAPRLARAFERRALALATVVAAVSTPLARAVQALGRADVAVIPNGADPDRFDPRRSDGLEVRARYGLDSAFTIGWAGILREWHGLELLLEAVVTLPTVTLLIVGDGPARQALERRANELGLQNRVVITGRVVHEDMPGYIAAMDIAVVADERTGVASPMKLLEYMSMARAIVAPAKENIRELIDDDVDGLLFEPGRADLLAAQLRRLVAARELRNAVGASARRKVEHERNWRSVAEHVLAVVRSAPGPPAHPQ